LTNNELKYFEKLKQKKYRDLENKFLIEGAHLVEECIKSGIYRDNLEIIFIREDFNENDLISYIRKTLSDTRIIQLEERRFNKLSETVNSQGIIGVVNKPHNKNKIDFSNSGLLVVSLDNINDPGNLGTILRTCHWFGADEVLISKDSADIYNSKVIRSSQGAIFNLIIRNEINLEKELDKYSKNGFVIYLSDAKADSSSDELIFPEKKNTIIVFGNEANGISKEILTDKNYLKIKIRGFSKCESLNVAVAAGIILDRFRNN
jgi:RNA methyltransferase, TrmH family